MTQDLFISQVREADANEAQDQLADTLIMLEGPTIVDADKQGLLDHQTMVYARNNALKILVERHREEYAEAYAFCYAYNFETIPVDL